MKMFEYGVGLRYGVNLEQLRCYGLNPDMSAVALELKGDDSKVTLYGNDIERFFSAIGIVRPAQPAGLKPFTVSEKTQFPYPARSAVFLNTPTDTCFASVVVLEEGESTYDKDWVKRLNTIRASELMRNLLARTLGALGTGSLLAIEIDNVLKLANSEEMPNEV